MLSSIVDMSFNERHCSLRSAPTPNDKPLLEHFPPAQGALTPYCYCFVYNVCSACIWKIDVDSLSLKASAAWTNALQEASPVWPPMASLLSLHVSVWGILVCICWVTTFSALLQIWWPWRGLSPSSSSCRLQPGMYTGTGMPLSSLLKAHSLTLPWQPSTQPWEPLQETGPRTRSDCTWNGVAVSKWLASTSQLLTSYIPTPADAQLCSQHTMT
jgi:hypothetical protein